MSNHPNKYIHHAVIVGGGFGGLYAAKKLANSNVKVTLIDKRNFHLFQPLLYQVATGGISAADIASPLRAVLSRARNTDVLLSEVIDINPQNQKVILSDGELNYDSLIVATGVSHFYFGNEHWEQLAPGLKTVEDALAIRRRVFLAFEAAEKELDPAKRQAWLTFVIVGGGPTGVELAGALAEVAYSTLKCDFRNIDPKDAKILLLQGNDRILPTYPSDLSKAAVESLQRLGVIVHTNARVTNIENHIVTVKNSSGIEQIPVQTILWAAGVKASGMGKVLANRTGVELDWSGRVLVEPDLSIANYPNIFVIGDLANFSHQGSEPLPGVAPVAMQEGEYIAHLIKRKLKGETLPTFNYRDRGSLAVIGRNAAIVDLGFIKLTGFLAWLVWSFLHIYFMIEFDNKILVFIQWAWSYFTWKRGARLITGEDLLPESTAEERIGVASII